MHSSDINDSDNIAFLFVVLFEDEDIAYDVLREADPLEQKKFGRLVRNFDQELWEVTLLPIVERGIKAKVTLRENSIGI